MTNREHFEAWFRMMRPGVSLVYDEELMYYLDDLANVPWMAWLRARRVKPTERGYITKDALKDMKADTSEIVDQLRGIYRGAKDSSPASPLQRKAADEIERLREELRILREGNDAL